MSIKTRDLRATLLGKFCFQEVPGTEHDAVAFFYGPKKIATTRFSRRSGTTIDDDDLLKRMAIEVRVPTLGFFKQMIGCSKNFDDYVRTLKENGYITGV